MIRPLLFAALLAGCHADPQPADDTDGPDTVDTVDTTDSVDTTDTV